MGLRGVGARSHPLGPHVINKAVHDADATKYTCEFRITYVCEYVKTCEVLCMNEAATKWEKSANRIRVLSTTLDGLIHRGVP